MLNQTRNKTSLGIALAAFLALIIILIFTLSISGVINIQPSAYGTDFDLACIGLTISIASAFIVLYLSTGKIDFFEFPVWFTLNVYTQVVLNVWLLQRDVLFVQSSYFLSPWLMADPGLWATRAILLIWGCLVILWAAYFLAKHYQKSKKQIQSVDQSTPRLKLMAVIWIVTWMINLYSILSGVQAYLGSASGFAGGNYLALVNIINDMVTFNLMIYVFKNPSKLGTYWIIFTCSTRLALGLIIGTKSAVFIILYLVMCYYYARKKLPKVWLAVGFFSLILVVPMVNTFRVNLFASGFSRASGASFTDRIPVLINSIEETIAHPLSDLTSQTRTIFETRQGSVFEVTAAFLAVHPQIRPFLYNVLVDTITATIIPRFLWLDKPTAHPTLYNIATQYLGASTDTSFASAGQFGDSYRMGGVIFTILWFVFLAFLAYKAYSWGPGTGSIAGIGFYLAILTGLITYEGDVFATFIHLLQFGIILFVLNRYVFFKPIGKKRSPIPV